MNKYRITLGFLSVITLIGSQSLAADPHAKNIEARGPTGKNLGYASIMRMAKAMGGHEKILAQQTVQFQAHGTRYEPEQSKKPGGEFVHILDYDYNLVNGLSKQVSKTEWFHDGNYPFIQQRQFSEIINGDQGAVFGFDTIISPPQAPMLSTRLAARSKQNLVSSPLALIHRANRYRKRVKFIGLKYHNGRVHQVIDIPGWDQSIRLYIDVKSQLPTKAETLEDDSIYGDTRWEVLFSNWTTIEGIKVPTKLTHKINSRIINEETRSAFQFDRELNPAIFTIPDELKTKLNSDQFAWGIRTSQWFNRYLSVGVPFDLDQRTSATLQIVEVANKVYHVRSLTHHSMVIEMDDYLIAVDSPLYNELSDTVLSTLRQRWPNKPVKYLILSHFHNDHSGGVRSYGAAGVTLIVGKGTKEHFETVFDSPHTLYPDTYARSQNEVRIKAVSAGKELVLSDGNRRVRIFDVKNRHAIGMLAPFIEDANMVFVSDLYNPDFFPNSIPQQFLSWSEDLLAELSESELDIDWMVGAHGGVSSYEKFVMQVESSR